MSIGNAKGPGTPKPKYDKSVGLPARLPQPKRATAEHAKRLAKALSKR